MIREENFIQVQGWMRTKLNLKGNKLLCYALIYGFSQDGRSVFQGSNSYVAEWIGVTRSMVNKLLKSMVEDNLIIKIEKEVNGVKLCDYKINDNYGKDIAEEDSEKFTGCVKSAQGGVVKSAHHNNIIDNNIIDNNIYMSSLPPKSGKEKKNNQKFFKPSFLEVEEYCRERGNNVDPERFIDFYESKGWMIGKNKMKDWKAAIRLWEKNNEKIKSDNSTNGIDDEFFRSIAEGCARAEYNEAQRNR